MKVDSPLPPFDEATKWLNPVSPNPAATKGRPILIHFWSVDSEVSLARFPRVAELRDRKKREGLRVIAVHQTDSEVNAETLRNAVAKLNLTEPCALDPEHKLRRAFQNELGAVPAYYLFDAEQRLRISSTGPNGLMILEDELDQMLLDLRSRHPFCPACEFFLEADAMFCPDCGLPLTLPGAQGAHPYYQKHHSASLPTVNLVHPDPLIGQVIGGKYELTARAGEGGTSVIYRARRVHIGDEVAVKIMLRKLSGDNEALARFRREASAAGISHHPNVIVIHDYGETSDSEVPAFIVMELVKGTPLSNLMKETRFSVERAERLMRVICAGVGAAHRRGVVHRDLKPDNILVVAPDDNSEFESVRVVDFGFAKLMTDAPANLGAVIGTPFYMSPEQCLGETVDASSDVYSLGAMFYELLAGHRPFTSEKVSGIINKHLYEPPPPLPPELGISKRISSGIMQALAKDPRDRPQTATALGRQLQLL